MKSNAHADSRMRSSFPTDAGGKVVEVAFLRFGFDSEGADLVPHPRLAAFTMTADLS
jgi:hypothetical protein